MAYRVVDGEASRFVKVTSGVPQGTVMGPIMFLLFINDIHGNLDSTLRLFADDALLYRSINTMNDSAILQNDIDKLVSWSKTWQMLFNVTKCHTMRISRKKEPVLMDYYIDGQKLSPVKNHPYLGVMLDKMVSSSRSYVTEILQSLDLDLLEDRGKAHRLNIFYLAINNSITLPIPNYVLPKQRFTRSFCNDSFIQANCNHDYYFYSFFPRTIRDWNSLPSGIRTLVQFFLLFKDHSFSAVRNN